MVGGSSFIEEVNLFKGRIIGYQLLDPNAASSRFT